MAEKYSLVGKTLTLKIADVFGTVDAVIVELLGNNETARIQFKSYRSAYEMIVPVSWLFTKNTSDDKNAFIKLAKGAEVKANIQLDEITTRKALVIGEGDGYLTVRTGSRTLVLPIASLKEAVVREDENLPAALPTTAPAARARPAAKPATVAPAPVAPVRAGRSAPAAAAAPAPAARRPRG